MHEFVLRDLNLIRPARWGRVRALTGVVAWQVEGEEGGPVEPVSAYLQEITARGMAEGTVRSYAYALLRWWRFLRAVDVRWDRATPAEGRDFVLWIQQARKDVADRRKVSAATAGTINPVTRKPYPGDDFKAATIRHSNAVVRSFYEFWIEQGLGPLINPMPRDRPGRPNAHRTPMQPFRPEGKLRYNPAKPQRHPRAMPDELWLKLFGAMPSNRDRAILALDISNGARASELLGLRGSDVDWGNQLVQVVRKGTRASQWLPASPDAFVWLRLYFNDVGTPGPADPVWRTLRRRRRGDTELARQSLSYDAWRAVLRRVNSKLGTNWAMHDLRHTCAIRMIRDRRLSITDVQHVLGHKSLTTTQLYLIEDDLEVVARVREHYAGIKEGASRRPAPVATGYDSADLAVLFGGGVR